MKIYKNIIVGAGPVGCHVFNELKNNSIIISGKTKKRISSKNIHPKIKLELKKQTDKFSDLFYSEKNNFYTYSSAEIAGFTNYWGKQFFNYLKNDNWPKKIFKKYFTYKNNLNEIDKIYLAPKNSFIKEIIDNDLTFRQIKPPILRGTLVDKKFKKKNKKRLVNDRVNSFSKLSKDIIKVELENEILYCRNLILCAGPIGNAMILLRSFKKINYITFKDDNPRMIFGFKLKNKNQLNSYNDNLIDIDIFKNKNLINYCTIYDVNPNHFHKLLRPLIYCFKYFLNKFFFYGQYWVINEYNLIKIKNFNSKIIISGKLKNSKLNKINFIKNLSKIGLKIVKILKLKFAYGFHYHCLKVNYAGKTFSINQFIKNQKIDKNIYCFDSSVIEKIGLKPPTKTFLATANYLTKKNKDFLK